MTFYTCMNFQTFWSKTLISMHCPFLYRTLDMQPKKLSTFLAHCKASLAYTLLRILQFTKKQVYCFTLQYALYVQWNAIYNKLWLYQMLTFITCHETSKYTCNVDPIRVFNFIFQTLKNSS